VPDEPIRRPSPGRWLLYAFGVGLPAEHRSWVLHDVTTRTWGLRHLARTAVQLLPVAIVLYVLIPGPSWVRVGAVVAGAIFGFFYGVVYMYETAEHRAVKAGYPVGYAAAVRNEARADERRARRQQDW
jgi:hypothetical protein